MVDQGTIRTTLTRELGPISAATLREAHTLVEGGRMTGKVVVAGW
jgi:NADPH:quinone reductase-like Zn-dependent oxidoreductase